jgi:hypothetical protein
MYDLKEFSHVSLLYEVSKKEKMDVRQLIGGITGNVGCSFQAKNTSDFIKLSFS